MEATEDKIWKAILKTETVKEKKTSKKPSSVKWRRRISLPIW
jgi:hypothetical protein